MTSLYRHYDSEGKLLYVGISLSAITRLAQHKDHSHWYDRISKVAIEKFETRELALIAERNAVVSEHPECNINLRKQKESPKKFAATELIDESREIIYRNVCMYPYYDINSAAKTLAMSRVVLSEMIKSGKIDHVIRGTKKHPKIFISGWQLLDFIESEHRK